MRPVRDNEVPMEAYSQAGDSQPLAVSGYKVPCGLHRRNRRNCAWGCRWAGLYDGLPGISEERARGGA